MITKSIVKNLPSSPGVYIFKTNDKPIYVGKSVNIRARVKSHIENAKLDRKEELIIEQADSIETKLTDSDFNAILLEAELIQKYQPKYNLILKDNKSQLYIEITKSQKYPKILLSRKPKHYSEVYFGPFSSLKEAQVLVKEIRKIVPFCTQPKLTKRACFYSKIGLCCPCPNEIEFRIYNSEFRIAQKMKNKYKKNINMVIKILKRKGDNVLKGFYKDLKKFIYKKNYEQAIPLRDKIYKLETLMFNQKFYEGYVGINYDNSVQSIGQLGEVLQKYYPKINSLRRIECYDVSNLTQKQTTASMVVFIDGRMDKNQYRKFRIKNLEFRTDIKYIEEVITRRFKNNWEKPDLIIVDGGKPQVKTVVRFIQQLNLNIPVIGIAKRPDRLIVGQTKFNTVYLDNNNSALNLIRAMRDESHRFAKKYHLLIREREMLYN